MNDTPWNLRMDSAADVHVNLQIEMTSVRKVPDKTADCSTDVNG